MKTKYKIILILGLVFIVAAAAVAFYLASKTILQPSVVFDEREAIVRIKTGSTVNTIAEQLYEAGVVRSIDDFILTAKLFGFSDELKAGKYTFAKNLSNYRILKILVEGSVSVEKVVIPEGYTARQIASLLSHKIEIDSARFMELCSDKQFIKSLKLEVDFLEGYLYPNTYNMFWGMSEKEVIETLVTQFHKRFADSLRQKAMEKNWSINQVITMASIIEGEALVDSERTIISAVYHNRLRRGMLLQADPTIQYIIPDGPRRLLNRDLAIDSPYNTYKYIGLPPGPVNNPGIKSIIAAIEPADVPYLYFVAKGDGSHTFSRTHREHLRAKRKFDQYRWKIRKEQNAKKNEN
ncbi:endolytic transglycosylase MltG [candidate division KSB1 bacterium]|nr:endolytic transglycosylase MltG [candidate division KSB1 bacterium]